MAIETMDLPTEHVSLPEGSPALGNLHMIGYLSTYPLEYTQKTMEHHYFMMIVNQLFLWAMFDSHVSLAEGSQYFLGSPLIFFDQMEVLILLTNVNGSWMVLCWFLILTFITMDLPVSRVRNRQHSKSSQFHH